MNMVNKVGEKSILFRTTGNEKARITVMLKLLASGSKVPSCMISNYAKGRTASTCN